MAVGQGLAITCIGKKEVGKTFFTRQKLALRPSGMPCVIYDINSEYQDFYNEELVGIDEFLLKVKDLKRTYICFEEATIFFGSRQTSDIMKNLLVRTRHTHNIIHMNFHSFNDFPKFIRNLNDFYILFRTEDTDRDVIDKVGNGKIYEGWKKAQSLEMVQQNGKNWYPNVVIKR